MGTAGEGLVRGGLESLQLVQQTAVEQQCPIAGHHRLTSPSISSFRSIGCLSACCRLLARPAGNVVTFFPVSRSRCSKARNREIAGSVCSWVSARDTVMDLPLKSNATFPP